MFFDNLQFYIDYITLSMKGMLHTQPKINMIYSHIEVLKKSPLFSNFTTKDINELLSCLGAYELEYKKDEMVLLEGDNIDSIGIILSGYGHSIKNDRSGKTVIVTRLTPGSPIGILLASNQNRKSPVSVQALEDLDVLFIPFLNAIRKCTRLCRRHEKLLLNIFENISEKAMILHDRNDCLIKSTIREKVLTYLSITSKEKESQSFSIPFDRKTMAEYLNVDRSALSRELSKMKQDGLIDYYKNQFTLL
jgi:CRP-like cAMP-binding protein